MYININVSNIYFQGTRLLSLAEREQEGEKEVLSCSFTFSLWHWYSLPTSTGTGTWTHIHTDNDTGFLPGKGRGKCSPALSPSLSQLHAFDCCNISTLSFNCCNICTLNTHPSTSCAFSDPKNLEGSCTLCVYQASLLLKFTLSDTSKTPDTLFNTDWVKFWKVLGNMGLGR